MSQQEISRLLAQAGEAHHDYEQTVLHGVFDENWPSWYADHVLRHGLSELLSQPVTADRLGRFLNESNQRYERTDKQRTWADFTAADIVEHFN